jgi:hypothetical protein
MPKKTRMKASCAPQPAMYTLLPVSRIGSSLATSVLDIIIPPAACTTKQRKSIQTKMWVSQVALMPHAAWSETA